MWDTIANLRENLSQIASDVLDTAEELEIAGSLDSAATTVAPSSDPHTNRNNDNNGIGEGSGSSSGSRGGAGGADDLRELRRRRELELQAELDSYKREVRRLQAAESKALTNLSDVVKAKEEELSCLREENTVLKKKVALAVENPLQNGDAQMQHGSIEVRNHQTDGHLDRIKKSKQRLQPEAVRERSSNGTISGLKTVELELRINRLQDREKDLLKQLMEKNQSYASVRSMHNQSLIEIKSLKEMRERQREELSSLKLQLQREQQAAEAADREAKRFNSEKEKIAVEVADLKQRLTDRTSVKANTVNQLQTEVTQLQRKLQEASLKNEELETLRKTANHFEKENGDLKAKLEELSQKQQQLKLEDDHRMQKLSLELENSANQVGSSLQIEEAIESQKKEFQKKLDQVQADRDKALRDLKRLRKHLLEKEQTELEKMDQDSEHIWKLEARAGASEARALQLEQALSQSLQKQMETEAKIQETISSFTEEIRVLKQKLSSYASALESKDVELSNLQTALGQYYAEIEAKEKVYGELVSAKNEIHLLCERLKDADKNIEVKEREKEEILVKLSLQEGKVVASQQKTIKLEQEISLLRRALEQSITRLNRMSSDSDYYVDRRIVIKLLVTYFQRQHSKEVLDLMVRMLGFSEEDKRAIGLAHEGARKGVVRGVLGLPSRFVGGLLKTVPATTDSSPDLRPTNEDQSSFADLWIDFLLKEAEGKAGGGTTDAIKDQAGSSQSPRGKSERRETKLGSSSETRFPTLPDDTPSSHMPFNTPSTTPEKSVSAVARPSFSPAPTPALGDTAESEFSTVPLHSTLSPSPLASSYQSRTHYLA